MKNPSKTEANADNSIAHDNNQTVKIILCGKNCFAIKKGLAGNGSDNSTALYLQRVVIESLNDINLLTDIINVIKISEIAIDIHTDVSKPPK